LLLAIIVFLFYTLIELTELKVKKIKEKSNKLKCFFSFSLFIQNTFLEKGFILPYLTLNN